MIEGDSIFVLDLGQGSGFRDPLTAWITPHCKEGIFMRPSSAICRAQEIAERDRAASATLENVRAVAIRAADAWSREAYWTERREHRQKEMQEAAAQVKSAKLVLFNRNDDLLSENPDRGRADG